MYTDFFFKKKDEADEVLDICLAFNDFAVKYFDTHFVPYVSWKYFLKQKNYCRTLEAFDDLSVYSLTASQREEIDTWTLLISSAIAESERNS